MQLYPIVYKEANDQSQLGVSLSDLVEGHQAGKQDLCSIRFGSPFSSKIVVYGHHLVTSPTQLMKH